MCSIFIHIFIVIPISFNTFLIKCNFIGCALVRDRLSIEFEKVFIFSYDLSIFFNIYSMFFSLT